MQSCRIPVFDAYLLLFAAIYVEGIIYCFPLSFKEKFGNYFIALALLIGLFLW